MEIAYAAHTESCTFLLDGEGICRFVTATPARGVLPARPVPGESGARIPDHADRCIGAQYVASIDLGAKGGLVELPRPGAPLVFARIEANGRIALVRSGPLVRFEPLAAGGSGVRARPQPAAVSHEARRASKPAPVAAAPAPAPRTSAVPRPSDPPARASQPPGAPRTSQTPAAPRTSQTPAAPRTSQTPAAPRTSQPPAAARVSQPPAAARASQAPPARSSSPPVVRPSASPSAHTPVAQIVPDVADEERTSPYRPSNGTLAAARRAPSIVPRADDAPARPSPLPRLPGPPRVPQGMARPSVAPAPATVAPTVTHLPVPRPTRTPPAAPSSAPTRPRRPSVIRAAVTPARDPMRTVEPDGDDVITVPRRQAR